MKPLMFLACLAVVLSASSVAWALTDAQRGYICGRANCARGKTYRKLQLCKTCCGLLCPGGQTGGCQDYCSYKKAPGVFAEDP